MRSLLILLALGLCACGGPPDVYAPPIERRPMDVYGADLLGPFASLGQPSSSINIVGGIDTAIMSGAWRWAFPHTEMRFYLPSREEVWDARVEFAIAKTILDKTGPQTLTVFVNNTSLDQLHYDRDGNYVWEKEVPINTLVPGGMNYLRIETDKTTTDDNGKQLAFILTRAGFVRSAK